MLESLTNLLNSHSRSLSESQVHESPHGATQIILFLFVGLFLGGLLREVNKKTSIPYTPMLFVLGIVSGFYYLNLGVLGEALHTISDIDPHGLMMIFLPILVFESGFNADWHIFRRQMVQILILAIPCVFVGASLIAFCVKVVLGYSDEYYDWLTAFMFGAVLSCTDPIAVIALLKESGASKKFNVLIEGESLINDGTGLVLLTIAAEIVKGRQMSPAEAVGLFCELTIGGALLGICFGFISAIWIRKIFNDEILVVNITLICCYATYYFAENVDIGIKLSGIIALVALGLFMAAFGRTKISSESEHAVHTFWRYAVYCAETIIFLLAGIIIGAKMLSGDPVPGALPITGLDFLKLLGLYVCMMICRFLSIAVFMPVLKRHGYGIKWKEVFVLTYGGLRGALGICFAMIIAGDETYDPTLRQFILFDMAGCAFLTLIINATTTGFFVKKAGLAGGSPIKQRVFLAYLDQFMQQLRDCQEELKVQPYLSAVDWTKLNESIGVSSMEGLINSEMDKLATMDSEYKRPPEYKSESLDESNQSPLGVELLPKNNKGKFSDEDEDFLKDKMITEARNRFLIALKAEYHHLFELSQCGPSAFLLLKQSADWDLDKEDHSMTSWDHVSSYFMNPTYIKWLFFLKSLPVVGSFARNSLFNHLAYVYDVVLNYVEAHETIEGIATSFPFTPDVIKVIISESEENRTMAEEYLNNYLNVSFPEVNKSIQMKKAAFSVLTRAKEYLQETFEQGQIEEKEFKSIKKIIDRRTYYLGESNEPWDIPPLNEFIRKLMFFSYFSDAEIKQIMEDAIEKPFQKDEFIIKENERADYLFVITRGIASESCRRTSSYFKEKKTVGSVISYHHIISPIQRYQTSVVADSAVYAVRLNLRIIKGLVKKHIEVQEYVWRESFYFLAKSSAHTGLGSLEYLDRSTLSHIQALFTFEKYGAAETIDLTKGGIFLKGEAVQKDQEEKEGGQPTKVYQNLTYFGPGPKNYLTTEKTCSVFHFNNFERIVELVRNGSTEREKSRSRSFNSFRKENQKQAVKMVHEGEGHGNKDIDS